MSSLARRRQTSVLFGSKRWWATGCWATRGHQEAYLRKLYGRKNVEGSVNVGLDLQETTPWTPPSTGTTTNDYHGDIDPGHYLDDFLRGRRGDEVAGRPVLPRASPTEKCVEFLTGARACAFDNAIVDDERHTRQNLSGCIEVNEHNLDGLLHSNYRDE